MKLIRNILSYSLSVLFYIVFGLLLLLFDPVQRICLRLFGYLAHKRSVDLFNVLVLRCLQLLGTYYEVHPRTSIPNNVPIIIVSNHQSMWDIPPLIWFLRKYHPKFISKIELGKKIPTISYNLKYGGSVLIDRKNPEQAMQQIAKMGGYIQEHNRSVVIFPEGTRSRTGIPKPFKRKGLKTLFEHAPEAYVLPVSISGSWKLQEKGMFPLPLGTKLTFVFHPALAVANYDPDTLIDTLEKTVVSGVISV
ncbi:lysophospholipid acyltransferase family protein [Altibacter sp. HG106]|uniref:lysophospholipid acyltransferase family protein n=1 Tax=Altibacter sp. HG106 TaxID=3023937 RepID=UPI003010419D